MERKCDALYHGGYRSGFTQILRQPNIFRTRSLQLFYTDGWMLLSSNRKCYQTASCLQLLRIAQKLIIELDLLRKVLDRDAFVGPMYPLDVFGADLD